MILIGTEGRAIDWPRVPLEREIRLVADDGLAVIARGIELAACLLDSRSDDDRDQDGKQREGEMFCSESHWPAVVVENPMAAG